MRVTRVIREFVEKEIEVKKYEKIKEIKGDYEEQKEKCRDEINDYMDAIIETTIYPQVCVLLRKYGMDVPPLEKDRRYGYGNRCYVNHFVQVQKETEEERISKETYKLREEAEEKIKTILLDLELGANKNELKEMLESIKFQLNTAKQLLNIITFKQT